MEMHNKYETKVLHWNPHSTNSTFLLNGRILEIMESQFSLLVKHTYVSSFKIREEESMYMVV